MRIAIVSDLHANLQAWKAAHLDMCSLGVDRIFCLGDIVGYGPNPAEVLAEVHRHANDVVLGNHDAVVCGKMDASLFNDNARRAIEWTRSQLTDEAGGFLSSLPLSLAGPFFRCTHGEFSAPAAFNYVIDPQDAGPSWEAVTEPLLFVGHTHVPRIFVTGASGRTHAIEARDFQMESGKRYLVSVGSTGNPRDGDTRASYVLFDTDERTVCWRRIPFDIDDYQKALTAAGLPEEGSYFLQHDPRQAAPPVRELLSFSPPEDPRQAVRDTVAVRDIQLLQRRVTRWKAIAAVAGSLGAALTLLVGVLWWRHAHRGRVIREPSGTTIVAVPGQHALPATVLDMPSGTTDLNAPIPDWSIHLGDRHKQSVHLTAVGDTDTGFELVSGTARDELRLASAPIRVSPGMRFQVNGLLLKGEDFDGQLSFYLALTRAGAEGETTDPLFLVKKPEWKQPGGWLKAQATANPIPEGARTLRLEIRGQFTGTAHIKGVNLVRRN